MGRCLSPCASGVLFSWRYETQHNHPTHYAISLHRSAMPFGEAMSSKRVMPTITLEAVEAPKLPSVAQKPLCRRPNFNRAPRGWGIDYSPESNELWKRTHQQRLWHWPMFAFDFQKKIPVYQHCKREKNMPYSILGCLFCGLGSKVYYHNETNNRWYLLITVTI